MILGIVASGSLLGASGGGGGGGGPPGASVHVDFLNDEYFVGGAGVAVGTLLGNSAAADAGYGSSGYNPAARYPGFGYDMSDGIVGIIGPLLDDIIAGCTIVIRWHVYGLHFGDWFAAGDSTFHGVYTRINVGSPNTYDMKNYFTSSTIAEDGNILVGDNVLAFTINPSNGEFSADGGSVVTLSPYPGPLTFEWAVFPQIGAGDYYLQSVTTYSPSVSTVDLPTYSV